MPFNTDRFPLKNVAYVLILGGLSTATYASPTLNCDIQQSSSMHRICANHVKALRKELNSKSLIAYLVTDAPLQLLNDTQALWLNQIKQCKTNQCIKQQFSVRFDDLNFYTSLNQSLTQHFLKFEDGIIATQPVHLQIHQLGKDKIKIEGIAYRNPNNKADRQTYSFLAYTSPDKKNEITDNEHDCHYQFDFQKSLLVVKTQQKGCEHFSGIYRLYD